MQGMEEGGQPMINTGRRGDLLEEKVKPWLPRPPKIGVPFKVLTHPLCSHPLGAFRDLCRPWNSGFGTMPGPGRRLPLLLPPSPHWPFLPGAFSTPRLQPVEEVEE